MSSSLMATLLRKYLMAWKGPQSSELQAGLPLGYSIRERRRPVGFVADQGSEYRGREDGTILWDRSEHHAAVIAPTGAGKGRCVLIPWLLSYPGSAVVVDPKAEAAYVTAAYRQKIGQKILIFDPWKIYRPLGKRVGHLFSFNPVETMLRRSSDIGDDCMTLIDLIVGEPPLSLQDPFWRSLAIDFLVALIGWVWVRSKFTGSSQADDGTLAGVWAMLHADDMVYAMAVILDVHGHKPGFPVFVRNGFVNFLGHEAEKVRTSVRSEAVSLIRIFSSARVQAATFSSTNSLNGLVDGTAATTVYVIVPPDRLQSHAALVRIILGTLLSAMARRRVRPRTPTLLLVDELGHIGAIPQLKQAITLLRGYGVRVALFIQSIAQLKSVWPADHETVLENCGIWLNFGNNTSASARVVADYLGDINSECLSAMSPQELLIHVAGQPTTLARRMDYLEDALFRHRFVENPYYGQSPDRKRS